MNNRILILDDDKEFANEVKDILHSSGYKAEAVYNYKQFIEYMDIFKPSLILVDIKLEDSLYDGLEVISLLQRTSPIHSKIIVISGEKNDNNIKRALELGAYSFISKGADFNVNSLLVTVKNALDLKKFEENSISLGIENIFLTKQLMKKNPLVGESKVMKEIKNQIKRFSRTNENVLILGDTGTGKEVVANRLYQLSKTSKKRFLAINCSAIPDSLIDSELFGHTKGAFTGATSYQKGAFERAKGGFLFLDEINSLNLSGQAKLLRAIENREIQVVGGETQEIDVRLIFSANQNLEKLVAKGEFRKDLYYRLESNVIHLPKLTDRESDICLLVNYFLRNNIKKYKNKIYLYLERIEDALLSYDWPGNVRELKNFCDKISASEPFINNNIIIKHFKRKMSKTKIYRKNYLVGNLAKYYNLSMKKAVEEFEKDYILFHLTKNNWRKAKTAQAIELERTTLYKKIKRYGIASIDEEDSK